MPQWCSVKTCRTLYKQKSDISFHRFPKAEPQRSKWLKATGLDANHLDVGARVCSKHFKKDDFVFGGNIRKLKKIAVPNVVSNRLCRDSGNPKVVLLRSDEAQQVDTKETLAVFCLNFDNPSEWATNSKTREQNEADTVVASTPEEAYIAIKIEEPEIDENNIKKENIESTVGNETTTCSHCSEKIRALQNELAHLRQQNEKLLKTIQEKPIFDLANFASNDKKILYYTGFQTYNILNIAYKYILPSDNANDIAINANFDATVRQQCSKLIAKNQFFLTLVRLRRGMPLEVLGDMFGISSATADKIFSSWINLMYLRLGCLDIWPSRDVLVNRASESLRSQFKNVIGSIVCTEFYTIQKQRQGATTLKSLMMIDPAGGIIYNSALFTGPISDKKIIEDSAYLDILKEKVEEGRILRGDGILADKGYKVVDLFKTDELNTIDIPVYRINSQQFEAEEVKKSRILALKSFHVGTAISRLKTYKLLTSTRLISNLSNMEKIYTVCVLLCNFRFPLLKNK